MHLGKKENLANNIFHYQQFNMSNSVLISGLYLTVIIEKLFGTIKVVIFFLLMEGSKLVAFSSQRSASTVATFKFQAGAHHTHPNTARRSSLFLSTRTFFKSASQNHCLLLICPQPTTVFQYDFVL
jgi:hypothetical protein